MDERTVDIFFFTGTGNTLLASKVVAEGLRRGGKEVRLYRLEKGFGPRDGEAALGIAVPVAWFSTYPFLWEILDSMPDGKGRGAFFLCTMGSMAGGLGGAMKTVLSHKGYRLLGRQDLIMPGNYGRKSTPEEKDGPTIARMEEKAAGFARDLLDGSASWRTDSPISLLLHRLSKSRLPWCLMARLYPLTIERKRCIRCGKCARLCPVHNITMAEYPVLGDRCLSCQRCMAFCPSGAIHVPGKDYKQYRTVSYGDLVADSSRRSP